jgi:hypothetical protein
MHVLPPAAGADFHEHADERVVPHDILSGMADPEPDEVVQRITELLEERVDVNGSEQMSLYDRVRDVVEAYEFWSNLAIRRLHEIHRLSDQECQFCSKWLDESE